MACRWLTKKWNGEIGQKNSMAIATSACLNCPLDNFTAMFSPRQAMSCVGLTSKARLKRGQAVSNGNCDAMEIAMSRAKSRS